MKVINDIYEIPSFVIQKEGLNTDTLYKQEITEANISQTNKSLKIEISVPETTCEPYKIKIDKGILTLSGAAIIDFKLNLLDFTMKEFSYGSFYRSVLLTESLENEKIQVSCHHGLLTINIPKKELAKRLASEIAVN